MMKRIALLLLVAIIGLSAQSKRTTTFRQSISPRPNSALVDPNDRVFADIVAGGGWETIITFVNMSSSRARFTLTFYDDNGNPLNLPFANPDGSISRFASTDFALDPNTSSELAVADVDKAVKSGWSYLSFVSGTSAVAGMAVVRSRDADGNVISEVRKRCRTPRTPISLLPTTTSTESLPPWF